MPVPSTRLKGMQEMGILATINAAKLVQQSHDPQEQLKQVGIALEQMARFLRDIESGVSEIKRK